MSVVSVPSTALWDHTQDAHGVGNEEGANSKSD
ncbi:unnamed protein product [Ectocarpus sp. CCAP 1310/34]|nr:unnamed protein product [Ectocarpus sp. CCAP 1310/34]